MNKKLVAFHFVLAFILIFLGGVMPFDLRIFIGSVWFIMLFGVLPYIFDGKKD